MLHDKPLTRGTVVREFLDIIAAGDSPFTAHDHVYAQLDEVLADCRDNDIVTATRSTADLLRWWSGFGNLSLRLLSSIPRFLADPANLDKLDLSKAAGLALEHEERFAAEWPANEGFGSSDFSAWMASYLRDLGFEVKVIDNRYRAFMGA